MSVNRSAEKLPISLFTSSLPKISYSMKEIMMSVGRFGLISIKSPFFIEEHAGLMILKNNFFGGINETNYGITFGAAGGIDFRGLSETGFLLGLGYNGGITFNGSTPSFNSFLLQGQLFF